MNNDRNMTCGVAAQAGSLADRSLHGKGSLFGMIKTSRIARIAVTALLTLAGVAMFPMGEAWAQTVTLTAGTPAGCTTTACNISANAPPPSTTPDAASTATFTVTMDAFTAHASGGSILLTLDFSDSDAGVNTNFTHVDDGIRDSNDVSLEFLGFDFPNRMFDSSILGYKTEDIAVKITAAADTGAGENYANITALTEIQPTATGADGTIRLSFLSRGASVDVNQSITFQITAQPSLASGEEVKVKVTGVRTALVAIGEDVVDGPVDSTATVTYAATAADRITYTIFSTPPTTTTLNALTVGGVDVDLRAGTLTAAVVMGPTITATPDDPDVDGITYAYDADSGAADDIAATALTDSNGVFSATATGITGPGTLTIQVTAEDGSTTQDYAVAVTVTVSNVSTLTDLVVTGATLNETFASGTTAYTADVANSVTSITVAPTAAAGATYEITATPSGVSITNPTSGVATLSGLVEGDNIITITVTAETGLASDRTVYTLTITRAAPPPSTDATLRTLTVDGVPVTNPAASGACVVATPCTVTIGSDALATVVATPTSTAATITMITGVQMNGTTVLGGIDTSARTGAANRGPYTVMLTNLSAPGNNTITILVTAEDATTTRTYTITATVIDPATAITLRWRDNESEVAVGTVLDLSSATADFARRSTDPDGEGPFYLELPDNVAAGDVIEVQYEVRSADGSTSELTLFITVPASSTP